MYEPTTQARDRRRRRRGKIKRAENKRRGKMAEGERNKKIKKNDSKCVYNVYSETGIGKASRARASANEKMLRLRH